MRGKGIDSGGHHTDEGITPAYAGKSDSQLVQTGQVEDHPRVCGEKFSVSHHTRVKIGSPPRMRGKD